MRAKDRHGSLFGRYLNGSEDIVIDEASQGIDQQLITAKHLESSGRINWLGLWAVTEERTLSESMRRYFTEVKHAHFDADALLLVLFHEEAWKVAEWSPKNPNPTFLDPIESSDPVTPSFSN